MKSYLIFQEGVGVFAGAIPSGFSHQLPSTAILERAGCHCEETVDFKIWNTFARRLPFRM